MLCRVADSLFWMSRYLERAECTVRMVDVNLQLLLESQQMDVSDIHAHWKPILKSTGDLELFFECYDEVSSDNVTEFLLFCKDNPSSVFSCVAGSRENARMIRDQISAEMWEIINRMYLYVKDLRKQKLTQADSLEFCNSIKEYSLLFQGITEYTFLHRVGYEFIKVGKSLERADKTGRLLDLKYFFEKKEQQQAGGIVDTVQWKAILRACGGQDGYHQVYVSDIMPEQVVEFLILSKEYPRSMLYSMKELQQALHNISGCPQSHYSNEAERLCGRLINRLNYITVSEIMELGLHQFLDEVKEELNHVAVELNKKYMFFPIVDPTELTEETESTAVNL